MKPYLNLQAALLTQITPERLTSLRLSIGLGQTEFWNLIGVTQSGGSRYESGRRLPKPVLMLLHLRYDKNPRLLMSRLRK